MKLRVGTPPWLSPYPTPLRTRRRQHKERHDVVVIGAGITGALVTQQLLAAGLSVLTVDKRPASLGSTAASTGLLLYQPDAPFAEIARRHGPRTARRVYELGRAAIHDLGRLVRRLDIDCGWRAQHTVYVASRPADLKLLAAEARHERRIGFPVTELTADDMRQRYALEVPGALLAPGAAQVNALSLTRGIFRHCLQNRRFDLRQDTRVRSVRENGPDVTLVTDRGHIRAGHVVIATGYECRRLLTSPLVQLNSTYVIASRRLAPESLQSVRHLMWETARPYFYLRTTHDHRIIFGGMDDPFTTPGRHRRKLPAKTRALEAKFADLFPALAFRADYSWTAAFADTRDGLPCIGPARPNSRVFYALGYGGNGITFSQIAASILRDACLGRPNPDARLFRFDRLRRHPARLR